MTLLVPFIWGGGVHIKDVSRSCHPPIRAYIVAFVGWVHRVNFFKGGHCVILLGGGGGGGISEFI